MYKRKLPPSEELTNAFELGYYSALIRFRREVPIAWRARTLQALAHETLGCEVLPDPGPPGMRFSPSVRGIKLIIMRCESAATMLAWRKDLTPSQKLKLQAALAKLQTAADRLELSSRAQ